MNFSPFTNSVFMVLNVASATFLQKDVLAQVLYTIEHPFVNLCRENKINQKFTKPAHAQKNGKAELIIKKAHGNVV